MTRIGSYEILRELHRTRHTLLYAARRAGDAADAKGRYALKVFDAESVGLLESVAAGLTFLESAAVQRKLAERGAKHWAPVLEVGDVDSPYYVNELYPLTAQRVVNRQAVVGERGLYTVVWSVVRGLTELRETFRRAHGNLKLSNVLIGGDPSLQSPKTTQVVLVDPSAEAASARDRSADLLAIGELIHQLVLRRPFRRPADAGGEPDDPPSLPPEWPVQPSATWDRLGPNGDRWLDLCNWLLSPAPADRPSDLVELAVALHQLTPAARTFPVKKVAVAGAALVVAAGGMATFWAVHTGVRADLQSPDQQWVVPLAKAALDPARRQRWARADPALGDIGTTVAQAQAQGVRFDVADEPVFSPSAYQNAKAALAVAQRVARDLTPDQWAGLARVESLRDRYAARGWAQPAAFLADLARGARPSPSADVAAGVDRLLDVDVRVRVDAGWLGDAWAAYDADLRAAEKTGDRALVAFARHLREAACLSMRLTDAGFDPGGAAALRDRLPLAAALAKVPADGWPDTVDRARLADDVDAKLNLADPSDDEVRKWLAAVDDYRLVPLDPKAEPLAGLAAALQKVADDVAKQPLDAAEQAAYKAERDAVEALIGGLAGGRFVRRDVALSQGEPASRAAAARARLTALRTQWVKIVDPEAWVASLEPSLTTVSEVLKLRWAAYVERQRADVPLLGRDADAFKRRRAQAEAVRATLTTLDRDQVPLNVAGLPEALQSAVLEKRELELQGLTQWAAAGPGEDVAVPAADAWAKAVDARVRAFDAWCALLRDLAKEFPIARELLTPGNRPDQRWAARDAAFWADPIVKRLVEKDVARIAAVAAVAGMSRTDLVAAARGADTAEVAAAAYARLGEVAAGAAAGGAASGGAAAAWPATAEDLATDVELRRRVERALRAVKNDAEKAAALEAWRAQGPTRWRRFAGQAVLAAPGEPPAAVERVLRAAAEARQDMRVTDAEADKLAPAARFNFAVYLARLAVEDPVANGGADQALRSQADAVARAAAGLADRPEVRRLAGRLARLSVPEPMAADARLLAPQPPDTLPVVVPAAPGQREVALSFARVQPPGRRPFYLSTTELSLGQFIDLVKARGDWAVANALLGATAGAGSPAGTNPTPYRGPRAWASPATPDAAIDRFRDTIWMFDTPERAGQEFVFADELRANQFNRRSLRAEAGGNPRYDHPMQQLPAQAALYVAALANCRLPTPQEWLAAYAIDQGTGPTSAGTGGAAAAAGPNVRDRTWRTQLTFARRDSLSKQWPDAAVAGAFWSKSLKPSVAGSTAIRNVDDKTLFFRPVTAGGGAFPNLLGNVAELVCDAPDAFDALPDRASAAVVRQFCQTHAGQIMVVGGSAFSEPALDPARPYPVNATAEPYADVGVRLAFTAPARSTAERLKWFLDEQPYLTAVAAAGAAE
jgi:hypothetical protein